MELDWCKCMVGHDAAFAALLFFTYLIFFLFCFFCCGFRSPLKPQLCFFIEYVPICVLLCCFSDEEDCPYADRAHTCNLKVHQKAAARNVNNYLKPYSHPSLSICCISLFLCRLLFEIFISPKNNFHLLWQFHGIYLMNTGIMWFSILTNIISE